MSDSNKLKDETNKIFGNVPVRTKLLQTMKI